MPESEDQIEWHRKQLAANRVVLEELEAGNTEGASVFPETRAEIERLKARISQSELIVAAMRTKARRLMPADHTTCCDRFRGDDRP
jgi:hypothetical protein